VSVEKEKPDRGREEDKKVGESCALMIPARKKKGKSRARTE